MKHYCRTFVRLLCFALLLPLGLASCTAGNSSTTETEKGTTAETSAKTLADTEAATLVVTEKPTAAPTDVPTEPDTDPLPIERSLRIGSYNLAAGREVNHVIRHLGTDIKNTDLDIVGVQEVDQFTARSGNIDTMKQLSKSSGLEHYAFFKAIDYQGGEYGIGILSKYPILETERYELPSADYEQRVLGRALIDVDGVQVNFFVTHLSYEALDIRTEQFAKVAEITATHIPYVLVGDFNTAEFNEFSVLSGTEMVNNHDHSIPTFPESETAIDNIVFSSEAWTFAPPATLENGHSDHHMLYAVGTLTHPSLPVTDTSETDND